jgi:hypothetical protein
LQFLEALPIASFKRSCRGNISLLLAWTSVDIDVLLHEMIHIPAEYHIDLQDVFKIEGKGDMAGMSFLAVAIINDVYLSTKDKCTNAMYQQWHRRRILAMS